MVMGCRTGEGEEEVEDGCGAAPPCQTEKGAWGGKFSCVNWATPSGRARPRQILMPQRKQRQLEMAVQGKIPHQRIASSREVEATAEYAADFLPALISSEVFLPPCLLLLLLPIGG